MGIPLAVGHMLAEACQRNKLRGRCLTLGRQEVNFTFQEMVELLTQKGYVEGAGSGAAPTLRADCLENIKRVGAAGQHEAPNPEHRQKGWISDKLFFAGLGFSEMHSLDYSGFEGADVVYDLNQPGLGGHLGRTYDLVFDGGTLEHVFDIRTVMRNLFEAVSPGGLIVHASPANNYVGHGFFQFSPCFFLDYYWANQFRIDSLKLCRHTDNLREPWRVEEYDSPAAPEVFALCADGYHQVVASVQRTEHSTWERIPQQGNYRHKWAAGG